MKVLDFGLAKALEPTVGRASAASTSPTITARLDAAAACVLGTAAYMSPEQARGRAGGQAQRRVGVRRGALRDAVRRARVQGRRRGGHARRGAASRSAWSALPPTRRAASVGCFAAVCRRIPNVASSTSATCGWNSLKPKRVIPLQKETARRANPHVIWPLVAAAAVGMVATGGAASPLSRPAPAILPVTRLTVQLPRL